MEFRQRLGFGHVKKRRSSGGKRQRGQGKTQISRKEVRIKDANGDKNHNGVAEGEAESQIQRQIKGQVLDLGKCLDLSSHLGGDQSPETV